MRFASTLAFSVLLGMLLPFTQPMAAAEEGDFDQLDRVSELQDEARAAARCRSDQGSLETERRLLFGIPP